MLDKVSDSSRIADRLLKKGLVHKQIKLSDKRLVDVTISDKGKDLLVRLEDKMHLMDAMSSNLSSEEIVTLNKLLDKLREKEFLFYLILL